MSGIIDDIKYSFNKGNNAIRKLIIINVVVFVITTILSNFKLATAIQFVSLPHLFSDFIFHPWTIVTYIFVHSSFWHILTNMVWLYFIGAILMDFTNNRAIYRNFFGGGILGGLLFLLVFNIVPSFKDAATSTYLVGASGGVTAIIIAAATIAPNYELRIFGPLSIKVKWIAIIFIVYNLMSLGNSTNTGGIIAHLGGAVFGYIDIKYILGNFGVSKMKDIFKIKSHKRKPQRDFKVKINNSGVNKSSDLEDNQEVIDLILDKISKSGYDSLTKKEKEMLFNASNKL